MGVGITAMFDRVQAEDDGSYSVTIRGGQRFLVQDGTAQVLPGTFGLTAVQPRYIYVRNAYVIAKLDQLQFRVVICT